MEDTVPFEQHSAKAERLLCQVHEHSVAVVRKVLFSEDFSTEASEDFSADSRRLPVLYAATGRSLVASQGREPARDLRHSDISKDILQARLSKLLAKEPFEGFEACATTSPRVSDSSLRKQKNTFSLSAEEGSIATGTHRDSTLAGVNKRMKRGQDRGWLLGQVVKRMHRNDP
ncbi:hypothetical protein F1559_001549 [Cyanidiococcus yangmingshanensis]|uniref:Uncharacterized protein n=1 Tax=Cyanidiococcus yangmingshanensis TaxID=2690220 RepID=A0A7J7IKF5_9RHOD|nr:hypothetical protein F1559_001549 [Cyanidiococcus yangmingshanensis]